MLWNWQQKQWPNFNFDNKRLEAIEKKFLYKSGLLYGAYISISKEDKESLTVELISEEALNTSEIEGDYLNRDSVQSSIRKSFGLNSDNRKVSAAEYGISEMMMDLYRNYKNPLSHEKLFYWHKLITNGRRDLKSIGNYRKHSEPMQVISGPIHDPKIHFKAPPSNIVRSEMNKFIDWYNREDNIGPITKAGIVHIYFESIHPFEDGNGRIGRAISEMILSEYLNQPVLLTLSHTINKNKKTYYKMLELSNKELEITEWLIYFGNTIVEAQLETEKRIRFMIAKTQLLDKVRGNINERQTKVLIRVFQEGHEGFKGGLSADNYISIASTSRATATRDLQDLVEKHILIRTGELKSTRYYLNIEQE